MIWVTAKFNEIKSDSIPYIVHITGHAPREENRGVSLSCAAVSAISIAFVEYIAQNELAQSVHVNTKGPGDLTIMVKDGSLFQLDSYQAIAFKGALDMLMNGLSKLSYIYPKHIKIDFKTSLYG